MKSTIVEHTTLDGRKLRWCLRCQLHTDENGMPDQDYYTARQYFHFLNVPHVDRCIHTISEPPMVRYVALGVDTELRNKKLILDMENAFGYYSADQRQVLRRIIERLS